MTVSLKSSRERPADTDGYRILVDRIWPRGISKKALALDEWAKEIAPTTELRKWFGHDHSKWQEFKHRYFRELDERPNAIARLVETVRRQPTTLVFGARDVDRNMRSHSRSTWSEMLRGKTNDCRTGSAHASV